MNRLSIKAIAEAINGTLLGDDRFITLVTTDSKYPAPETMFIGIKGERFDGNDFAHDFLLNGGECAVVEKDIDVPNGCSVIRVSDTRAAIRDIAEYYRKTLSLDVVAVTGSVGKTSTKDMLNAVISQGFKTGVTKGNFNNEIGVPLTVFSLDDSFEKAVIEMGMNNLGEISRLTKIARPDVAVITNIGTAHIGNLGSRENILKAKLEILEGLKDDGIVVLNADDPYLWGAKDKIKHKTIYYSIENNEADISAYDVFTKADSTDFSVDIDGTKCRFTINVAGRHHVYNALSAIACGLHFGMSKEQIAHGVSSFAPTGLRQKETVINGIKIIEDCYNASLDSMKSSLATLKDICQGKRSVAVLGDMLEQGEFSCQNHREVGSIVSKNGIDILVTVGKDAHFIAQSARENGVSDIYEFSDNDQAATALFNILKKGDTVLFKASRGMRFEEIAEKLQKLLKGNE